MGLLPQEIAALIYYVGGWGPLGAKHPTGTLTAAQKAAAVGFLDTAIAVCLAESGGDPNVVNKTSDAAGLWQILPSAHASQIADEIKYWNNKTADKTVSVNLLDMRVNTSVARDVYKASGGWHPWETYTTGAYKPYTGHGAAAFAWISVQVNLETFRSQYATWAKGVGAESQGGNLITSGKLGDITDSIPHAIEAAVSDTLGAAVSDTLGAVKQMGIVIGVFIGGLLLLGLGIWYLADQTKPTRAAKATIKGAAKDAALAAVVA